MRKEETLTKDYAHINGFEIPKALRQRARDRKSSGLTKCI